MKLPAPPADLNDRPLPLALVVKGDFWRLWRDDYPSPLFWSKKGLYRFDSKSAPYGVLYTACTFEAAVVEVFGDQWLQARKLALALCARYWVSRLGCPVAKVVNTLGPDLNRLGVDSMLFASTHYRLTRRWARAFMGHPDGPEGILYHSRKNPELTNCAFFDRPTAVKGGTGECILSGPCLEYTKTTDRRLVDHPRFGEVLDRYEIALV